MRTEQQYWDHWKYSHRWFLRTQYCLTAFVFTLLILSCFIPISQGLSGNGGSDDPWITSSPVTYHISDSTPTGSSVSSDGLVLSMDMETLRSGKMKNFADETGITDGLLMNNPISSDSGIDGKSYLLDGVTSNTKIYLIDDSIRLAIFSSQNFTLSMWVKKHISSSHVGMLDHWGMFSLGMDGSYLYTFLARGAANESNTNLPYSINSNWHLLLGSYDRSELRLYLDGVLVSHIHTDKGIPNTGTLLNLNANGGGGSYDSYLDNVLISSRCWNTSEIQTHFQDTFTEYGIQTGTHYSYQAVQNQTSIYPAWSVDSNAPNVTIDSVGKVMGYWESWENGTYWINVTIQNVNGYAWQNYSIVVVESAPLPATFQFTDTFIMALFFYIICLVISLIGFGSRKTILSVIALVIAFGNTVAMLTTFVDVPYIPLLFLLVLGIMPVLAYKR